MGKTEHMAFCGFDCAQCPVYIATQASDEDMKSRLAWDYTTTECQFSGQDMNCRGCKSGDGICKKMCDGCYMRSCAMKRELEHCGLCSRYPCKYIEQYMPVGEEGRKRLDKLAGK